MKLAIITTDDLYSKIVINKIFKTKNIEIKIIKINIPLKYTMKIAVKGLIKSPFYFLYLLYEMLNLYLLKKKLINKTDLKYDYSYITNNINSSDSIKYIQSENFEYIFFIRPTQIISKNFLNKFPNCFNMHNTLLPKYRGLGGIFQTLANNDDVLGITIHKVITKLDAGDIVSQDKLEIPKNISVFELTLYSYINSDVCINEFLNKLQNNKLTYTKQIEEDASLYSWPSLKEFLKLYATNYRFLGKKNIDKILIGKPI